VFGSEYRQSTFWVGSWDVYPTGQSQLVAHSLIETVYNGCGVREKLMPLKTENSGGSLNIYIPRRRSGADVDRLERGSRGFSKADGTGR